MDDIVFSINNEEYKLYENLTSGFLEKKFSYYTNCAPSTIGIDFLTIGLIVSMADRKISRAKGIDGWTRNISLKLPVLNLEKWNNNKKTLQNALNFVSGDYWNIEFIPRSLISKEIKHLKRWSKRKIVKLTANEIKYICMFSGGLDSFIGATNLLADSKNEAVFVNIRGGGNSFKHNFESARDALCGEFNIQNKDKYFKSFLVRPWKAIEDTTRSRSFTFFTHAIAYSTCFSNPISLIIPENGTISLNVPLNYGRYGSCSTRTTHPYYIAQLQKLVDSFDLKIKFLNPYQFKTKGEMLLECKRFDFVKNNISSTMSCSHPNSGRYLHDGKPSHCGTCLPCMIREAAELKAYSEIVTSFKHSFSPTTSSTKRCLKLRLLTFDKSHVLVEIQKNGEILNNFDKYCDLYLRSINELQSLFDYRNY